MMKHTTKRRVPKAVNRMILRTTGASAEIARRANRSQALICLVLAGKRNCTQPVWDAIVDWIAEPRTIALAEMATLEMQAEAQ